MSKKENSLFTELTSTVFKVYPELDRDMFSAKIDDEGFLSITSYYEQDIRCIRENKNDATGIYYYFVNVVWVKLNPNENIYNYYKIDISWDEAFITPNIEDFFDNCDYKSSLKNTTSLERLKKNFLNNFSKYYEFFKNEYSPVYKLALAEDIRHKTELNKITNMLKFKASLD